MKRFLLVCAALTGVLVFGVHAQAAVDSSDILIKALVDKGVITEDEAASVRAEIANIRQDEEASRKSYNITGKRPIKIGGYVQERYTGASQAGFNDTLEPKRVRLVVNGDATERLDFKVQVDFAGSRKGLTAVDFAKTKSTTAQFGKPLLLDAVLGYKLEGDRRLDIGQFKVPFSIENLTSSPFLDLITRSVVVEALVPGRDTGNQGRDIGAQYSGVRNLREDGSRQLQYFAGVFDGAGINVPDDNDRKDSALRAVIRPGIEGLSLGASWYHGAIGSTELSHDRVGGELVYSRGPWKVQSEYIAGKDAAVHKSGWYAYLLRQINPVIQGVVRVDSLDRNTGVEGDDLNTFTAGINYFLTKDGYSRWQLNYERDRDDSSHTTNNLILAQFQAGF